MLERGDEGEGEGEEPDLRQCGPLSLVEIQRGSALIGRELHSYACVSYAIKNQLVASKAPH